MSDDSAPRAYRTIGERVKQYLDANRYGFAPNTIRLARGEINRCLSAHFDAGFDRFYIGDLRTGGLRGDWGDVSTRRLYHMARFLRFGMVAGDFGPRDPVGYYGARTFALDTLAGLFQNPVGEVGALVAVLLLAGYPYEQMAQVSDDPHVYTSYALPPSVGEHLQHIGLPLDLLRANRTTLGNRLERWLVRQGVGVVKGAGAGLYQTGRYLRFFMDLGENERSGEPTRDHVTKALRGQPLSVSVDTCHEED